MNKCWLGDSFDGETLLDLQSLGNELYQEPAPIKRCTCCGRWLPAQQIYIGGCEICNPNTKYTKPGDRNEEETYLL